MELQLDSLDWQDRYKLLVGAVVPRPIAFVSTQSKDGTRNLAAFSFFNGVCPKPLIISFAPMFKEGQEPRKDTLRNVQETGEFVVNIVTNEIVKAMNETSPNFPEDVDEFEVSGLTPVPSTKVTPPRVLESPVNMECKLVQVIQLGHEQGSGSLVLGEVVHMQVADDIYYDGKIDGAKLDAVGRMAGNFYTRTQDTFQLTRPQYKDKS